MRRVRTGLRQHGLTLVELLVALVIGLVVVGALLVAYLASEGSARQVRVVAQMTEDAQLALTILAREVQAAGSVDVNGLNVDGTFVRAAAFRPVFGCSGPFTAPGTTFAAATCAAATGSHAIELNRQADTDTAFHRVNGAPTDCGGRQLAPGLISNRYYVARAAGSDVPELYCASSAYSALPLVPNIVDLHLWYGIAPGWSWSDPASRRVQRYVAASDIAGNGWGEVVAVRLCVLVRSDTEVLGSEDSTRYLDCDGAAQNSTDRRLYRAFYRAATLRNKAPM